MLELGSTLLPVHMVFSELAFVGISGLSRPSLRLEGLQNDVVLWRRCHMSHGHKLPAPAPSLPFITCVDSLVPVSRRVLTNCCIYCV